MRSDFFERSRQDNRNSKLDTLHNMGVLADMLKHLATLSIGAIALIAGFLASLVKLGDNGNLLIVITASFFVCIIASVISYVTVVVDIRHGRVQTLKTTKMVFSL